MGTSDRYRLDPVSVVSFAVVDLLSYISLVLRINLTQPKPNQIEPVMPNNLEVAVSLLRETLDVRPTYFTTDLRQRVEAFVNTGVGGVPVENTKVDYTYNAKSDAIDMIENFRDEIVEKLVEDDEASDDLNNDYEDGDAYHHENHVDREYDLLEAANLLDELDEYEETDSGLWEGLSPRQAISTQAAFTYGIAVYSMWREMIGEINDDYAVWLSENEEELDEMGDDIAANERKREKAEEVINYVIENNKQ